MTEIKRYHHLPITVTPTDEIHPAGLEHPEGYWVRYSDHLAAMAEKDREIDELRRKLAVFTEGMPSQKAFDHVVRMLEHEAYVNTGGKDICICDSGDCPFVAQYLRRIAAIDDKGGGG